MRPQVTTRGAVAAITTIAAAALASAPRSAPAGAEPQPASVEYRHAQDVDGVTVTVRNPAASWTLRGVRVTIVLFTREGSAIRTYGPNGQFGRSTTDPLRLTRPGDVIECCALPDLAPGAEHSFRLWPVRNRVHRVTIEPVGGPVTWEPMP